MTDWPDRRKREVLVVSDATTIREPKKEWTGAYACLASTGEHCIKVRPHTKDRTAAPHEADGLFTCLDMARRRWPDRPVLIVSDQEPIARIADEPERATHLLMQVLCRSTVAATELMGLLEAVPPEIKCGRIRLRWASGHQGTGPFRAAITTADTYARAAAIGLIDPDEPPSFPPSRGSIDRTLSQLRRTHNATSGIKKD